MDSRDRQRWEPLLPPARALGTQTRITAGLVATAILVGSRHCTNFRPTSNPAACFSAPPGTHRYLTEMSGRRGNCRGRSEACTPPPSLAASAGFQPGTHHPAERGVFCPPRVSPSTGACTARTWASQATAPVTQPVPEPPRVPSTQSPWSWYSQSVPAHKCPGPGSPGRQDAFLWPEGPFTFSQGCCSCPQACPQQLHRGHPALRRGRKPRPAAPSAPPGHLVSISPCVVTLHNGQTIHGSPREVRPQAPPQPVDAQPSPAEGRGRARAGSHGTCSRYT